MKYRNCKRILTFSVVLNILLLTGLVALFIIWMRLKTPPIPGGCTVNSQCPSGQSCINGSCQKYTPPAMCKYAKDCPRGYKCNNGRCTLTSSLNHENNENYVDMNTENT